MLVYKYGHEKDGKDSQNESYEKLYFVLETKGSTNRFDLRTADADIRRKGYASRLMEYIKNYYEGRYKNSFLERVMFREYWRFISGVDSPLPTAYRTKSDIIKKPVHKEKP